MTNEQFFIVLMSADRIDDADDRARFVTHCKAFLPCVAGGLWGQMVFTRMAKLAGLSAERFIIVIGSGEYEPRAVK